MIGSSLTELAMAGADTRADYNPPEAGVVSAPATVLDLSPRRFYELSRDVACYRDALRVKSALIEDQDIEIRRLKRRIEDLEIINRDLARRAEALRDELAALKLSAGDEPERCTYPACSCPFDGAPGWCAKGLKVAP